MISLLKINGTSSPHFSVRTFSGVCHDRPTPGIQSAVQNGAEKNCPKVYNQIIRGVWKVTVNTKKKTRGYGRGGSGLRNKTKVASGVGTQG